MIVSFVLVNHRKALKNVFQNRSEIQFSELPCMALNNFTVLIYLDFVYLSAVKAKQQLNRLRLNLPPDFNNLCHMGSTHFLIFFR